ncbi:hypothetical protein Q31b_01080 [Novipirellula aureliae]|uniref:DUF4276 domain-containing protein n=1 Tax=Novipirellula aureliae TaxID=2527966 RepID=A0A5C6EAE0_9BACT|nr:DUF4276 family protein [Novipirellula aureliae]TWU44937.1 hypothetical protein Q31b_01080 [Novipirellula aureliae]
MNKLVVMVEGETEQTFVRDQLSGHLALFGVTAWPILPGRGGRLQGVRKWAGARADIIRSLNSGNFVTTMFDFYGVPEDWPGRSDTGSLPWSSRAEFVETKIAEDIGVAMGNRFNPDRFVPYLQLHEFEALAFSNIESLASVTAPLGTISSEKLVKSFTEILDEAGTPEAINDSYDTCPSRRISKLVAGYRKRVHGPIVTRRIGLSAIREKCKHFAGWLEKLESIGTAS